jgi:hypothetical protein
MLLQLVFGVDVGAAMAALKIAYKGPPSVTGAKSAHAYSEANQADCGEHQGVWIYQSDPD